jgi:hypothetical protein
MPSNFLFCSGSDERADGGLQHLPERVLISSLQWRGIVEVFKYIYRLCFCQFSGTELVYSDLVKGFSNHWYLYKVSHCISTGFEKNQEQIT